jgi:AmiR/NasT family two-component response regulator
MSGLIQVPRSRVLVIEDEAITAADIQDRLEVLGYEVAGWGTTGAEAIELARNSAPDLILMDIMLKGPMNGIQAAHLIRVELSIPVIFLTANSDEAVLEKAKISEPFAYLLKPFEERQLRTNIEMALYKSRMERERERILKELQDALNTIKTLSGLLPICAWCKSVRDDSGYWMRVEQYVEAHSQATFSHSVCPECASRYFGPEMFQGENPASGESGSSTSHLHICLPPGTEPIIHPPSDPGAPIHPTNGGS